MNRQSFDSLVETIGSEPLSLAKRIRQFLADLFGSSLVKHLQAELLNLRLDKDRVIESLKSDNAALKAKIEKLELAIWPQSSRAGQAYAASMTPPAKPLELQPSRTSWDAIVQQRVQENEELDRKDAAKEN